MAKLEDVLLNFEVDKLTNSILYRIIRKTMGTIIEPEGVDFIIKSKPLTKEQEKSLSEFIAKRKQEIAEMEKHNRTTQASNKSKRTKTVKAKHKSK